MDKVDQKDHGRLECLKTNLKEHDLLKTDLINRDASRAGMRQSNLLFKFPTFFTCSIAISCPKPLNFLFEWGILHWELKACQIWGSDFFNNCSFCYGKEHPPCIVNVTTLEICSSYYTMGHMLLNALIVCLFTLFHTSTLFQTFYCVFYDTYILIRLDTCITLSQILQIKGFKF